MTADHPIPDMGYPLGTVWRQPSKHEILVTEDTAVMAQTAFDKLKEYSSSVPSGVYPGKMWKGIYPDGPFLHWFGIVDGQPGQCSINSRPLIIQDWKKLLGIDNLITVDLAPPGASDKTAVRIIQP